MDNPDDRVAYLIAAALADELLPDEAAELNQLLRIQPWIDEEIASMRDLISRVSASDLTWTDVAPDTALVSRISAHRRLGR
jgi:hypothetical protein